MPSCDEILRRLYGLQRLGIRPGLDRVKGLLDFIGNPHAKYPTVHVAGTNGKGSTSAAVESALAAAGLRTGLYTSPHLIRFNERIKASGRQITGREIVELALFVEDAMKKSSISGLTFFEFTTVMAFEHFRLKKVDLAVIEAGMGGRWDATNVITPLAAVITNIAVDHAEFLGNDTVKIAGEKAGIIKEGVPLVTGVEDPKAFKVVRNEARKKGAPLFRLGRDFGFRPGKKGRFDYLGVEKDIKGLSMGLAGLHQYKNASCALAALEAIGRSGYRIAEKDIRAGLKGINWPGRAEVLKKRPLVLLDAAHNPHGAKALADYLKGLRYERLVLVLGIMADKDIDGVLKTLVPLAGAVILARPSTDRAEDPARLLEKTRSYKKDVSVKGSVKDACKAALRWAGPQDAVCVTGSIFTIGEAKRYLSRSL